MESGCLPPPHTKKHDRLDPPLVVSRVPLDCFQCQSGTLTQFAVRRLSSVWMMCYSGIPCIVNIQSRFSNNASFRSKWNGAYFCSTAGNIHSTITDTDTEVISSKSLVSVLFTPFFTAFFSFYSSCAVGSHVPF